MSREIPYRPMHGPKKHVSPERMAEILAKHSKPSAPVVETPKAESQSKLLAWKKPVASADGSVHVASECGHFRIERYERDGKRMYFAMTYAPEFRHELGRRFSADEAKALCEAEARKRAARDGVSATGCGDGAGGQGK